MDQIYTGRIAKRNHLCYCCGKEIEKGSSYTDCVNITMDKKYFHKRFHSECFTKKSTPFERIVEKLKSGAFPVRNQRGLKGWVIGVAKEPDTDRNLVVLRGWKSNIYNAIGEDKLYVLLDSNGYPI